MALIRGQIYLRSNRGQEEFQGEKEIESRVFKLKSRMMRKKKTETQGGARSTRHQAICYITEEFQFSFVLPLQLFKKEDIL